MKTLKKLLWLAAVLLCIVSCSKEEVTEKVIEVPEGKVLVETEIVVDGVIQSKTRASSNAGYTTGDGLYDSGDKVIVAAVANEGYELAAFYDKKYPSTNLGTSYEFPAAEPRTFKAEFARKYTITVSASPTAGGTVSGGGTYRSGKPCTLTATPNAGYTFDGWYEGSTKLSSNTSYSFTVSSNRTIIGKFAVAKTAVSLTITTEREGESNNTYQEWDSYILFDSSLGSRMKFKIYGDTSSSEYYSGPIVYYPVTVNANTRIWYEYYYFFSDYGDREEYSSSSASSFDILIDGILIQSLSKPLSGHHNKVYETDKYKITITVVEK